MKGVREYLSDNTVIFDGAIATMLMAKGMPADESPEGWMLGHPESLRSTHEEYVHAGAEVLTTNTFGASRVRLREFGLEREIGQICETAVRIAREASEGALVAGSIGPLGGVFEEEVAFDVFLEQANLLVKCGVDLILIETMSNLREADIALRASTQITSAPVIVNLAFGEGFAHHEKISPESFSDFFSRKSPFGIGTNCGGAPEDSIEATRRMRKFWKGPLLAEPSGGNPVIEDGKPVWFTSPKDFAEIALKLRSAGANLIGSCCGTTPEHTFEIAKSIKETRLYI